jgi:hypothetical protein
MARIGRGTAVPQARSNGHTEDAISHDPSSGNHTQRISSVGHES